MREHRTVTAAGLCPAHKCTTHNHMLMTTGTGVRSHISYAWQVRVAVEWVWLCGAFGRWSGSRCHLGALEGLARTHVDGKRRLVRWWHGRALWSAGTLQPRRAETSAATASCARCRVQGGLQSGLEAVVGRLGAARETRTGPPPKTLTKEVCLPGALLGVLGSGSSDAPSLPLPPEPPLPSSPSAHRKPKMSSTTPTNKQATPATMVSMAVTAEVESGSIMFVPTKMKKSALPNQPDMNPKRRLIQFVHLIWTKIMSRPNIAFQPDRTKLSGLNAVSAGFRRVRMDEISTPMPVPRAVNLLTRSKPSHVQHSQFAPSAHECSCMCYDWLRRREGKRERRLQACSV